MGTDEQERERRKAIERANAYREMMSLWAWKDFVENVIGEIRNQSIKQFDDIPTSDLASGAVYVAEARGIRKGLTKALDEVGYILEARP